MNEQIKNKWVKALRSGEYEQGEGRLRCGDKYCCLGVLTDLYAKEKNLEWHPHLYDVFGFDNEEGSTPNLVLEWSEVEGIFGWISALDRDLSSLNDSGNYTFHQIADIIEEHWRGL